ncbi:MAG TPA: glutamyl-tRNA reductase [Candidatus Polarisedimenticolaceae bacterium]|nr:glutamyl-tRNA reductase [Candidatus Polarisedimenticolaceae bacterium]
MLVLVGSNHRSAPLAVRERMSFPLEKISEAHTRLMQLDGVREGMILSTCNRVEILAHTDADGAQSLQRFLADQHRLSLDEVERYTYRLADRDAIRHLFSVASGLDSMIIGEPQILGQVKQAYQMAKDLRTLGPALERLLQHGLATAKRVRSETGISRNAVSVAYAAVELARKIFGHLDGRTAMLLGAGKMGELVGRHLVKNGVGRLWVCSRTYTHAVLRAESLGGAAVHWEESKRKLREVDIVVSCTGAPGLVLTKPDVAASLRGRKIGPLFLIDIAVPRDIDPQTNDLDNVYVYDIDALQGVIDTNLEQRRQAAERAKRMISSEVDAFVRWMETQEITPLIVALRETMMGVGRLEVERFRSRLGPLDERQQQTVEELARAIIQKILHRPIRRLRSSVERGDVLECSSLYREIFGIDPSADGNLDGVGPDSGTMSGPRRLLNGGKKGR